MWTAENTKFNRRHDHHSCYSLLSRKIPVNRKKCLFRSSMGSEPMASVLALPCSTNWAMKNHSLIGRRPICWVHLNQWKEWNIEWRWCELQKYNYYTAVMQSETQDAHIIRKTNGHNIVSFSTMLTSFLFKSKKFQICSSPLVVFFLTGANSPASSSLLKNATPKPLTWKSSSMLINGPKLSRYSTRAVALLFPIPLVFESSSKLRILSSLKISWKKDF